MTPQQIMTVVNYIKGRTSRGLPAATQIIITHPTDPLDTITSITPGNHKDFEMSIIAECLVITGSSMCSFIECGTITRVDIKWNDGTSGQHPK